MIVYAFTIESESQRVKQSESQGVRESGSQGVRESGSQRVRESVRELVDYFTGNPLFSWSFDWQASQ